MLGAMYGPGGGVVKMRQLGGGVQAGGKNGGEMTCGGEIRGNMGGEGGGDGVKTIASGTTGSGVRLDRLGQEPRATSLRIAGMIEDVLFILRSGCESG